uniref:Uncharacterized protein n=1 Tax=viral metagenome TaxID=1070528 RepID=A0A6M3Y5F5_9ZZZZ
MRILLVSLCCLLLTGCASWCEITRDDDGKVKRVDYSGNQHIIINEDGIEGNNKAQPFKDIININAFKDN